jgi:hypothetical protein
MNTTTTNPAVFESTYALIVRSEERERSASESAVYLLVMLSVLFSLWHAAHQPVTVPATGIIHTSSIVQEAAPQQARV